MRKHWKAVRHTVRTLPSVVYLSVLVVLLPAHIFPADEMSTSYEVGKSRINVHVEEGTLAVSNQDLMQWVHWASD